MLFIAALNSSCIEGQDAVCPDSVLNALHSHGWVIPVEQQVGELLNSQVIISG